MTTHLASVPGRFLVSALAIIILGSFPAHGQEKNDRSDGGSEQSESEAARENSRQKEEAARKAEQAKEAASASREARTRRVDSKKSGNVSPLVQAAKSSGSTTSKRSFTDADLKDAKGSLIIVEGTNVREPKVPSIEERAPELFQQPKPAKAQEAANQYTRQLQMERLEDQIRVLGEELGRLENEYLVTEEDDYRESVNQRFVAKQKELAAAQKKLKELKDGGN